MTKIGVMLEQFIGQCYSKWPNEQQQQNLSSSPSQMDWSENERLSESLENHCLRQFFFKKTQKQQPASLALYNWNIQK